MSTEPKVYFYKPEDDHDEYEAELAPINVFQERKLFAALSSVKPEPDSCVKNITIERRTNRYGKNKIENFYMSEFYDDMSMLCMGSHESLKNDSLARIRRCQTNLMAGKCVCPYMTKVIGEILFPYLYSKEKTR